MYRILLLTLLGASGCGASLSRLASMARPPGVPAVHHEGLGMRCGPLPETPFCEINPMRPARR